MKIRDVVERVDRVKPNDFELADKIAWLNEVEGMVQTDVLLLAAEEIMTYGEEDGEVELLVSPPFDKMYISYLMARIDFANGEYDKYQNTNEMFNEQYAEFVGWFADAYRPADRVVAEPAYFVPARGAGTHAQGSLLLSPRDQ